VSVAKTAIRQQQGTRAHSGRFDDPELRPDQAGWRLFLVSCATLFIEILLIRWIGTEVRIFAYFQNLALVACFLGFGLGCYWAERRRSLLLSLSAMIVVAVLVELPFEGWTQFLEAVSTRLALSPDAAIWGFAHPYVHASVWVLTAASVLVVAGFLMLLVAVMIPLGQSVGFYLAEADDVIRAYSINLAGSIIGLWIMSVLAYHWLPPLAWFGLAGLLLLCARRPSVKWLAGSAVVVVAAALAYHVVAPEGQRGPVKLVRGMKEVFWSPYQKLQVFASGDDEYGIAVNNTGFMTVYNVNPDFLQRHPQVAAGYKQSSYDAPFRFVDRKDDVLVVGAGAGNDVAAALRNGAGHVDAVEIDPLILSLGERLNAAQPYSSPKVQKTVNDARNFMRTTGQRYDVIVFGLLDSHTQFSDFSNMRVDNYVYTEESFRQARRLLKPNGVLILKFEVRDPWLWMGQRFYVMLDGIFGKPPIAFYAPRVANMLQATVFLESDDPQFWARAGAVDRGSLEPPKFPLEAAGAPPPASDDWPYVYHRARSIPRTYLTVAVILLVLTLLLVRRSFQPRRSYTWPFFFLGGGFLLLETQLVSRLALYFGTTWVVNAVALTAILVVLVLANGYVARFHPRRLGFYYVPLVLCLAANYAFPWERLSFGATTIGILLSAAYAAPVFFAGIIFTENFRRTAEKANALGANIVGAVAGGLAQNVSFIVGMKALLLIAVFFYLAAAVFAAVTDRSGSTA
jgi:spermidine synthase